MSAILFDTTIPAVTPASEMSLADKKAELAAIRARRALRVGLNTLSTPAFVRNRGRCEDAPCCGCC